MARPSVSHVCQNCGASYPRWSGRCEACGEWNSLVEEVVGARERRSPARGRGLAFVPLSGSTQPLERRKTAIAEFDRVLGGGLVPGSAVLIGGDPGIGKSTLLLQAMALLARAGRPVAYVSGEEAIDQVRLRALRLGVADAPLDLAASTSVDEVATALDRPTAPDVAVIDSIQTMALDALDSAPGTVAQVRASAQALIRIAKARGTTLLLVGHVTKEGAIAGPRVLEHMVDAVLYFEGDRGHQFRILRAVKNRFGPTDEIGVFAMTDRGLSEVPNPSALFLAERRADLAGCAVFAGMEGTRPVLVEIQALVAGAAAGSPRRTAVGCDPGRLAMIVAVLEARCGVSIAGRDIYLNVAGGLKVSEPAADLAVAAALISSLTEAPLPADTVVFGEIGLGGEVRQVGQSEARLKEASRLGFAGAITPERRAPGSGQRGAPAEVASEVRVTEIDQLAELVDLIAARADGRAGAAA